jgi:FAD/FMN-containing dehydrogenase
VCLNDGGVLLDARGLDRFIQFDAQRGVLRCEAGVLLGDILELVVPHGWFLPVTPGTRFVTVGGAIANDVHGKNHHRAGTFGRHVRSFELLRSDGRRRICSDTQHPEWYRATIGGLGLTGVIVWAELALLRIPGPWMACETIRYARLEEFLPLAEESDGRFDYTVAWLDCLARGDALGRGVFYRANHSEAATGARAQGKQRWSMPLEVPFPLINRVTLGLFNAFYYYRRSPRPVSSVQHYQPFFYPLDNIRDWNRIYGRAGFMQFQCVVPHTAAMDALREILHSIAAAGSGSFLAVLKRFGGLDSPGLLSFPRPGVTLALDFPNRGKTTTALLGRLDDIVRAAHGAVYPAKDACMAPRSFQQYYPHWQTLEKYIDARFSSSFWRRVTQPQT